MQTNRNSKGGGGPQLGSAPHQRQSRDWIRSEGWRVTFRPAEFEDLQELAAQWRVPVATAAWALLHEKLSSYRRVKVRLGPAGAALGAAIATLSRRTSGELRDDATAHPVASDPHG